MTATTQQIREFLIEDQAWDGEASGLSDDLPLLESGVLDSMSLLRLVGWLEERYGIAIADEQIVPDNFGTLTRIAALVESRSAGPAA